MIQGFQLHLTIIRRRRSEYSSRELFHNIAEPEENNCFGIIAQVIIKANAFSFFFFTETSKIALHPF